MSHINDLLNRNIPLTSNQQYIYTMKKNHINTDPNNFRISLISFENNQWDISLINKHCDNFSHSLFAFIIYFFKICW